MWRITQTKTTELDPRYEDGRTCEMVHYVDHFQYPDVDPPATEWTPSSYEDVKNWHERSREQLEERTDLKVNMSVRLTTFTIADCVH